MKGAFYRQLRNYLITFERDRGIYHVYSPEGTEIYHTYSALDALYTVRNI
ncbi:MAG: hypothetical protein IJ682_10585 [Lachnospiraceae bacterium]|nr:hypothetical protein [Lachnospiraceae bacterium]